MSFISELKRRNVFRMAGLYLVGSWLITQVAATLLPVFEAPSWVMKTVVGVLAIGFIPALIFAWVFELTPEGLKRDSEVSATHSIAPQTARRMERSILVLLVMALLFFGVDKFVLAPKREANLVSTATQANVDHVAQAENKQNEKSIAVLPFDNLSSDPEQGYFADGLTEEILNALASLPNLMVTARTSSFHFKDKDVPVDEIGKRLGVEHILEGSVRRAGDQLRVTAQLVRAHDGFHLWSKTYDRPYNDAFAVQADIAEQVATALGILLDEQLRLRMHAAGVRDPNAYALFARGFELFREAHNGSPQRVTLEAANAFFDQAVAAAPGLWVAHYHSADHYSHILLNHAASTDLSAIDAGEEAHALAELQRRLRAASDIAPNEAARDSIQLTEQFLSSDWTGLAALLRRNFAQTEGCVFQQWTFAGIAFGLAEESRAFYRHGIRCNALDDALWEHASRSAAYAGDPLAGLEIVDQALARPELALSRSRLHFTRLNALVAAGRLDEARAEARRIGPDMPNHGRAQVWIAAVSSDIAALDALLSRSPKMPSHHRLEAAALKGDRVTANDLARAIDARPAGPLLLMNTIHWCMCGAPFDLKATPNLAARLKESGLTWPPISPIKWPLKDW